MQIVIDIAKNEYDALDKLDAKYLLHIIKDGTPLPKGHGRLIDADELKATMHMDNYRGFATIHDAHLCFAYINTAKTVVEADKEGAEE